MLDVTDIALLCIYVCLVVNNFQGAEYAYNTLITEFFGRNEKQLHEFFKQLRKIFENTFYSFFSAAKELLFAFLAGLLPRLPPPIPTLLEYMGIQEYLNKALDKYKNFEQKKKKDEEYKQKQREIEKNRPESPSKRARINLAGGEDDTPGEQKADLTNKKVTAGSPGPSVRTTAEGQKQRRIYDPTSKSFKWVNIVDKTADSKKVAKNVKASADSKSPTKDSAAAPSPSKGPESDGEDAYSDEGRKVVSKSPPKKKPVK